MNSFCVDNNVKKLQQFCADALDHKTLYERIGWQFDANLTEEPKCELQFLYASQYEYKVERNVLRCPIKNEKQLSSVYFLSVKSPPPGRLMFYVLMSTTSADVRRKNSESLHTAGEEPSPTETLTLDIISLFMTKHATSQEENTVDDRQT